jgi:translation elongation factor EF-1alpha
MPWFKGPTLLQAVEALSDPKQHYSEKPLRLLVFKVYNKPRVGVIMVAKVASGILQVGQEITVASDGKKVNGVVLSIEIDKKSVHNAVAGNLVGFTVGGLDKSELRNSMGEKIRKFNVLKMY